MGAVDKFSIGDGGGGSSKVLYISTETVMSGKDETLALPVGDDFDLFVSATYKDSSSGQSDSAAKIRRTPRGIYYRTLYSSNRWRGFDSDDTKTSHEVGFAWFSGSDVHSLIYDFATKTLSWQASNTASRNRFYQNPEISYILVLG